MRLKFRKAILFFFIFSCLSIYSTAAIAKDNAALSKVKGDISVFKEGITQITGKLGMPLFARDKVVTIGKESSADITFPTGDVVRIMPDSELEIKISDFKKKTSSVRLKLLAGKIFNVVRKFTRGSIYEVETRVAVAGVRGTIWSAEITGNQEDVFMVKEGKVATVNPKIAPEKEIIVSDLKKTIVKADKPPTEPIPLTPEEIAMFDILDDLLQEMREDMREDIKDSIAEDIMDQQITP